MCPFYSTMAVVLKVGGAPPWGGAMSQTEKEKKTADMSLVSESSLSSEMQGAGLTQTNQIPSIQTNALECVAPTDGGGGVL